MRSPLRLNSFWRKLVGGPVTPTDAQLEGVSARVAAAVLERAEENRTHDFFGPQAPQDAPGSTIGAEVGRDSGPHPLDAANRKDQNACTSASRLCAEGRCQGLNITGGVCGRTLRNVPVDCIVCCGTFCHSCCNRARSR